MGARTQGRSVPGHYLLEPRQSGSRLHQRLVAHRYERPQVLEIEHPNFGPDFEPISIIDAGSSPVLFLKTLKCRFNTYREILFSPVSLSLFCSPSRSCLGKSAARQMGAAQLAA